MPPHKPGEALEKTMLTFFLYLTMTLFIIVCVFMILVVLVQKGRGGGLASAFGGAGGNTAFGSKTGDVLTWATSIIFGVFLILAVALNLLANKRNDQAEAGTLVSTPAVQQSTTPEPTTPTPAPAPQVTPATQPATGPQ